jgi:hypothetical protein
MSSFILLGFASLPYIPTLSSGSKAILVIVDVSAACNITVVQCSIPVRGIVSDDQNLDQSTKVSNWANGKPGALATYERFCILLPQSTIGHVTQDFPFAQSYLSHVPAG